MIDVFSNTHSHTFRGIGAGIALDLAKRGANVIVNYTSTRGEEAAAQVAKEIEVCGSKVKVVKARMGVIEDHHELIDAALAISESGKIDILVHNAATGDDCYLEEMTEEFYEAQTDVNLKGGVKCPTHHSSD